MPQVTLLRALKFILLLWLSLLFLWTFLPSPKVRHALRDNYIQTALGSEQTIRTVHEWIVREDETSDYVIDWQLVANHGQDSVTLLIGQATVNLTDLVLHHTPPFLSDPFSATVPSGDLDHIINMPWFDSADAILFHHQMHGLTGTIGLRALVLDNRQVQIWKDTASWNNFNDPAQLEEEHRAIGLLASFSMIQTVEGARASTTAIKVSNVKGRLPSTTYRFRKSLLDMIAPSLTIVLFLLESIIFPPACVFLTVCLYITPVFAAYAMLIVLCWCLSGCPPFSAWSRRSPLTSWVRKSEKRKISRPGIWGPAGPVFDGVEDSVDDKHILPLTRSQLDWRLRSKPRKGTGAEYP